MAVAGEPLVAVAHIPWSPNLTDINVGSTGYNEGWYVPRIDGLIDFGFRLEFGTSCEITGIARILLPVAPWVGSGTGLQMTVGMWTFRDSTAPDHDSGSIGVYSASDGTASFNGAWDGSAPNKRITTAVPFTVASGDVLSGQGTYLPA